MARVDSTQFSLTECLMVALRHGLEHKVDNDPLLVCLT